jgi:hypothetical protein
MSVCATVDPCRCPLCGQDNRCGMEAAAQGQVQAACWCTRVQFSAALLQSLPEAAKGKACICQACAQKAVPAA